MLFFEEVNLAKNEDIIQPGYVQWFLNRMGCRNAGFI